MRSGKLRSEPISGEPIWLAVKMLARHFCYDESADIQPIALRQLVDRELFAPAIPGEL